MAALPPPHVLIQKWLHDPHAITVAAFAISAGFIGLAAWLVLKNIRPNEPRLRAPLALPMVLMIAATGVLGANRLLPPWGLIAGGVVCGLASLLFYFVDHRRFVPDPAGKIVADRWQIVLVYADFRWTRDKANRHFFFSVDDRSDDTQASSSDTKTQGDPSPGKPWATSTRRS